MPNQKLALFRVAINDLVTQVPNIKILHSALTVPGTKNTQCPKNYDIRREASGRCILLPQNLRALRIFVPGTVRALLGHCAKPKFLQVVTASTHGELKKALCLDIE